MSSALCLRYLQHKIGGSIKSALRLQKRPLNENCEDIVHSIFEMLSFLIHLLFQNRNLSIFIVVSLIMLCSIHVVEPTVPVQTVDTRDFFICSPDESTTTHTHRPSNIVIPTDVLPNLVGTLGVGLTAAKVATTIKGGIPTKVVAVGLTYFTASLGVGIAQNITNPDVSRLNANSAISRILHSALETVGPNSTTSP